MKKHLWIRVDTGNAVIGNDDKEYVGYHIYVGTIEVEVPKNTVTKECRPSYTHCNGYTEIHKTALMPNAKNVRIVYEVEE